MSSKTERHLDDGVRPATFDALPALSLTVAPRPETRPDHAASRRSSRDAVGSSRVVTLFPSLLPGYSTMTIPPASPGPGSAQRRSSVPGTAGSNSQHQRRRKKKPQQQPLPSLLTGETDLAHADTGYEVVPHRIKHAITRFDESHRLLTTTATDLLRSLKHDCTSLSHLHCFDELVNDVRRNRFHADEAYDPFAAPIVPGQRRVIKTRRRPKWKVEDSIWAPRAKRNNSKTLYETEDSMRSMFDCDWELARQSHGLERMIMKNDDRGDVGEDNKSEVEEVKEALWRYHRVIYGAFDYYSMLFTEAQVDSFECDVFTMTFNGFLAFVRDCKLATKGVSSRDLETIWVAVNAVETKVKDLDRHNQLRTLNRQEFLQVLVHIALTRYIHLGKIRDFSDAIEEMMRNDIARRLPPAALQNSNHFRSHACYCEQTELILRKHSVTMHSLYVKYAQMYDDLSNVFNSTSLMSIGEWLGLLKHIGLFEWGMITHVEARQIFMWSRIRSIADFTDKSERKLRHLLYEDFMEAMVRLATCIALPTDKELHQLQAKDAGEYLIAMAHDVPHEFEQYVTVNKTEWNREPRQHASRCIDHLMMLVCEVVEQNTSRGLFGAADDVVEEEEAAVFLKRMTTGKNLLRRVHSIGGQDGAGFHIAMEAVRQKLLDALKFVAIFSALSEDQLVVLRNSMVQSSFQKGEYVFEQDDDGDSFYVIMDGTAKVLRAEEDDSEGVLTELQPGAYFGERALLKNDKRFASVKASSALETMCITRQQFETVLGPLQDLVPDHY